MTNKLPPFGTLFKAFLDINVDCHFSPYIFCGKDAWKETKAFLANGQFAMCLPPSHRADSYEWPVKNLSIIVYDTGSSSVMNLKLLAYCLLKEGAKLVWIESPLCPIGTYFVR